MSQPEQTESPSRAEDVGTHTPSAGVPRGVPGPPGRRDRRLRGMGWRSRDILRATALVFAFYYGLRLLWFTSPLVLTAFLGVLFALAVSAGVDYLERWRIRRGLGAALIVFGTIGIMWGAGAWMWPTLRTQGREIQRQLPDALDKLEGWAEQRGGVWASLLVPERAADTSVAPVDTTGAPGAEAVQRARAGSLRERVLEGAGRASRYLFPFLTTTLTVVAGLLLLLVLTIYIAAEPETYRKGLMHLFPHRSRVKAGEVLSAMATVLRRWLVTQLIAMVSIGVVTTIVLLILDVRGAFALGLIAGLLEFIPTIGPVLSAVPAVAMGFLDSPQKALWVVIAYIVIQQLENHLLIPMLMKEGVDLPPVVTILGQGLMALLFGFLGLLVAVPLIAAVMVPIKMLYVRDVVGDEISIFEDEDDDD